MLMCIMIFAHEAKHIGWGEGGVGFLKKRLLKCTALCPQYFSQHHLEQLVMPGTGNTGMHRPDEMYLCFDTYTIKKDQLR